MQVRLFFFSVLIPSLFASDRPLTGRWDATVQYGEERIPFTMEFSQNAGDVAVSFFNGDERVTSTSGKLSGDSLVLAFDHYATRLTATYSGDEIKGTYGSAKNGFRDFEARRHNDSATSLTRGPEISGVWDLPTESPKGEHAWRLIVRQEGALTTAAILRVDGDTGALTGSYQDGRFVLNHFDGARASVVEIIPQQDGTLDVALHGFKGPTKHFKAVRLEQAKAAGLPQPSDPDDHTRLKIPNEPLRFSFPDVNGRLVSNTDRQFQDKVVIVNVTGSWCPNCHDEAPFLESLYRKYHSLGLEIVALDFEEPEQLKDLSRLRAFTKKYGIEYTYLVAGEPSELQAKLPQIENLNSWPTTFFIGRDGRVTAIHAGFAAAASGRYHDELKREVTARIEHLLSENVRASR